MKILPVLLTSCCLGLLCLSLTACSTHSNKSAFRKSGSELSHDADSSASEPEESAQEELEALNRPGAWEYGADQQQIMKEMGIDPAKYDFPITVNKQVLYYLELFQGKQRNYFTHWLARSTIYRPYIEAELKKAGLPLDLVFLAMIESGYNPSAYSPAEACGLWQFIEGTGRTYGLKIDTWVDERREPEKATKAAARYLARLYGQFGDWYLAVAAYNAGEKRIDTAINTYNTKDFWEIAASEGIFLETKRYVPKLIAAIIIARNPEKYGFTDINYLKPHQYDTIEVPGGLDLEAVAMTANTTVKQLQALNNELRKNQTPPKIKEYTLRIPAGTKELVASNLHKLRPVSTVVYTTHTVKKGDTLNTICDLYNISKTTLLKANNIRTAQLKNGLRLQIPTTSTKYVLLKDGERLEDLLAKVEKKDKQIVVHQAKADDTLAKIAARFQVPVASILKWNKLTVKSKVKNGQPIKLYLDRPAPAAEAMASLANSSKVAVAQTAAAPVTASSPKVAVAKAALPVLANSSKVAVAQAAAAPAPVPANSSKVAAAAPAPVPANSSKVAAAKAAAPVLANSSKVAAAKAAVEPVPSLGTANKRGTAKAQPAKTADPSETVAKKPIQQTWYVVKNGDTLLTIAKKFQTSAEDIRELNKLSGKSLQTGDKLLVKKG